MQCTFNEHELASDVIIIAHNIMVDVATYRPEIVHDMFHHRWQ